MEKRGCRDGRSDFRSEMPFHSVLPRTDLTAGCSISLGKWLGEDDNRGTERREWQMGEKECDQGIWFLMR